MRGVESQSGERIRAVWLGKLELEGPGPFLSQLFHFLIGRETVAQGGDGTF